MKNSDWLKFVIDNHKPGKIVESDTASTAINYFNALIDYSKLVFAKGYEEAEAFYASLLHDLQQESVAYARGRLRETAKHHLKINRQRKDFHFKVAGRYAAKYKVIAVEGLDVANMVRGHFAKSILDAAWASFVSILKDKAESAGHQVVEVDPRYTTQKCHECGELVQKTLSVRTHLCPHCGYVADRDVNAAKNILARALGKEKRAGAQPSHTKPSVGKVRARSPSG